MAARFETAETARPTRRSARIAARVASRGEHTNDQDRGRDVYSDESGSRDESLGAEGTQPDEQDDNNLNSEAVDGIELAALTLSSEPAGSAGSALQDQDFRHGGVALDAPRTHRYGQSNVSPDATLTLQPPHDTSLTALQPYLQIPPPPPTSAWHALPPPFPLGMRPVNPSDPHPLASMDLLDEDTLL